MTRSRLPYSLRKFLRREKARIRREISPVQEAEKKILELVAKNAAPYKGSALRFKSERCIEPLLPSPVRESRAAALDSAHSLGNNRGK